MKRCFVVLCLLWAETAISQCYKIEGRVSHSNNQRITVNSNGTDYALNFDPSEKGIRYARGVRVSVRTFYDKKSNTYATRDALIDLPLRSTASKVASVELLKGLADSKSCLKVPK